MASRVIISGGDGYASESDDSDAGSLSSIGKIPTILYLRKEASMCVKNRVVAAGPGKLSETRVRLKVKVSD